MKHNVIADIVPYAERIGQYIFARIVRSFFPRQLTMTDQILDQSMIRCQLAEFSILETVTVNTAVSDIDDKSASACQNDRCQRCTHAVQPFILCAHFKNGPVDCVDLCFQPSLEIAFISECIGL